jgi:hypothetical protein
MNPPRKRIAIISSGISGLAKLWRTRVPYFSKSPAPFHHTTVH